MKRNEFLTIKQVANWLQISAPLAYKLVETGDLPGYKFGRLWRFREQEVAEWIDSKAAKQ